MSWIACRKNLFQTVGKDLCSYPTKRPAHPGLALDRFYKPGEDGEKLRLLALHRLLEKMNDDHMNLYSDAYKRIHQHLALEIGNDFSSAVVGDSCYVAFTVETKSRMLISPNSGSTVTEGSLALHHTYGVPMIPGSTVKGQVRAYLERIKLEKAVIEQLLGTEMDPEKEKEKEKETKKETDQVSGLLYFFDALWQPELKKQENHGPLARDLVNPHHSKYYTAGDDREFPSPSDEPVPAFFMTVRPGQKFRVILSAPQKMLDELLFVTERWMIPAFESQSFGTKGTSGYGRFSADGIRKDLADKQKQLAEEARKQEAQSQFETAEGFACSEALAGRGKQKDIPTAASDWVKRLKDLGSLSKPAALEVRNLLVAFYEKSSLKRKKKKETIASLEALHF